MSKRNPFTTRIPQNRVLVLFLLLFVVVSCSDDNGVDPVGSHPGIPDLENRVHTLINQHRVDQGLAPLTLSDIMTAQARTHSHNMADGSVPFSHDGFKERVDAISAQINILTAAENVATNSGYSDPARIAVESWIKSEGHRNNIEGNYDLTGIGIAQSSSGGYYLTQLFAKSN